MDLEKYPALETANLLRVGNEALEIEAELENVERRHRDNADDIKRIGVQISMSYRENPAFTQVGPMFGYISGALDILSGSWWCHAFGRLMAFLCWHLFLASRPGGNDFLISRWMLSRRVEDRDSLIARLAIPGPIGASLYRALVSLCQQSREFHAAFAFAVENQGPEIWREFWESIQPHMELPNE